MQADELTTLGVGELAAAYRTGTTTPERVVQAVLERISAEQPRLNAFLQVLEDQALRAARNATEQQAAGIDLGPLHGVPVTVKDNVDLTGTRTTCASRVMDDEPPASRDAWIVAALRAAGAVIVGKTNLSEFAYGDPDPDGPFGLVHNPRRLGHQPGTSSSGAAASVAAGLGALAIGTDTGGSVRHPAAVCGVVGLKPTFGQLPMDGIVPNNPRLDHLGLLARSVDDVETTYRRLREGVPHERTALGHLPPARPTSRQPEALRVGVVTDPHQGRAHPQVVALFERLAADLAAATAGTTPVELSTELLLRAEAAVVTLSTVELCIYHERFRDRADRYAQGFLKRASRGLEVTGIEYAQALAEQVRQRDLLADHLERCDVILTPANLHPSPPHDQPDIRTDAGALPFRAVNSMFDKLGSLTGFPCLIVPVGEVEGLPVSVQLIAGPGRERRLFEAGRALESQVGQLARTWGVTVRDQ
jgi:aspartyl-tRNA(Asn)/glutamyl-tRNA(Gln) amidotransferase subunit A